MASLSLAHAATHTSNGIQGKQERLGKCSLLLKGALPGKFSRIERLRHVRNSRNVVITAMGTKIVTTGGDGSKSKPKFGTVFFKPKDDEEDEQPSKKPGNFSITSSTFSSLQLFAGSRKADENTVFVANADGKTGARIALELLHEGFKVRAGVQDLKSAQQLAQFASQYGIIDSQETKRLNVVEFSPEEIELVAKAIGNASKVVVTVGDGEQGPVDKVSPTEAAQIVQAAALAKVANLIVVAQLNGSAALSDGPAGFFAKLFSFFTGKSGKSSISYDNLVSAIVETDLKYTIFQTSDTDSVSDTFASTSRPILASEGSVLGGKISKLQVASVVAAAISNISISENKVYEVSASSEASSVPIIELLGAVAEDDRRQQLAEQRAREAAEEEARLAAEEALEALKVANELEEEAKKLAAEEARAAALAETARARALAVSASVSELSEELKAVGGDASRLSRAQKFSFGKSETEETSGDDSESFNFPSFSSKISIPKFENIPKFELKLPEVEKKKPVAKPTSKPERVPPPKKEARAPTPPPKPVVKKEVPAPSKKKGGFFSQETIYIDDSSAGDF